MRSVRLTVAGGLLLTAVAIVATLSRPPLVVAGTNGTSTARSVELESGDVSDCQQAGSLPRGTTAVRLALETIAVGPRVAIKMISASHVVTEGSRAAGWGISQSVTVPVRRVPQAIRSVILCTSIGPTVEPLRARGVRLRRGAADYHSLREIRMGVEYLRPGSSSWLSLTSIVTHRMGIGNAASGAWIALVLLAVMLGVSVLVSWLALSELR